MGTTARAVATIAMLGGLAALAACGDGGNAGWRNADGTTPAAAGGPAGISVTAPANGATNVPTAAELALSTANAQAGVVVTDASGAAVEGTLRPDGATWVPATQLKYATTYNVTVTTPTAKTAATTKTSFTTMAKPAKTVSVSTPLSDGKVYGVAMPIVLTFGSDVPKEQRANVERRLLVVSEPAQEGSWNWFSAREVHYRPKEYWQEGTKLTVRAATGGLQLTANAYGAKDVTLHATIGERLEMVTEDSTHTLTVTKQGQVIKSIPISLGKASTPSSSGAMVVMDKNQQEEFTSTDPSDPYQETVYWTQRLTVSGQYLHAAPWSVDAQGKRNVSHGCTNMSTENAKWLYGITHIGDPVTVKGTPRKLDWGNGWTDWDRTWDEYVKGSALAG
jgi:lipoprotein-anchoring transpeptidase ErfK/SrfK